MTLTELRETLSSVTDAVPVPVPDVVAFERRVAGLRRRRTAGRAAGAVAALAVVASGSSIVLGGNHQAVDRTGPARESAGESAASVPVVVGGTLRMVSGDGTLGPEGPAVASIVGSTSHGVVALTDDDLLGRVVDGAVQPLVPGRVRTAYLDGDAIVYEDDAGLIRWWGIEPEVTSSPSAQTELGRLMAAGRDMAVIAEDQGLMLHDSEGVHELFLDPDEVKVIRGVDAGGGVVAVRTDKGVTIFRDHGLYAAGLPGDRIGALAPDGHAYARPTESRRSVELLDPRTMDATPVDGPTGLVEDLGWAPDGDLLAVAQADGARTLWRCAPDGTGCAAQLDDPTGTLRLR